jgi:uncharacterized coiled-coil protein SlyX
MKPLIQATREEVYNAPTIPWNNGTYTPISNMFIMDMIYSKLQEHGLTVKSEEYKTARTKEGLVKGVIGSFDISTPDSDFGQRIMFRNSYDKSMNFAFVAGMVVWICTNGCIKGDYQYKRIHRGVIMEEISTTQEAIIENINGGFTMLQTSFEKTSSQLRELQHFEISPTESYNILGKLFFEQQVISITQMSIIKKEFEHSKNFHHLGDKDFTAYDLYNHVTESLKTSHPLSYISDHVKTHALFEETFKV